ERAERAHVGAEAGHAMHLGLRHEVDVAGRRDPHDRDVEPVEVVDRQHGAARARETVRAVHALARRQPRRHAEIDAPEPPGEIAVMGLVAHGLLAYAVARARTSSSMRVTTSSTSRSVVSICWASPAG